MYTIFYKINNEIHMQRCATFKTLTTVVKAIREEGAIIMKVQNSNGEKVIVL